METIKVNMTPCEDVQTIHASQNDNEAREWGFELHNNGEKIDSSSISDQMVFKAYEGGTEHLLPENGSVPVTAPFLGDIRYPQGLLTDQEFTYRESPTESDGLAFVENIKGNTIVWNQILREISTTYYAANNSRTAYSNNSVTLTATTTSYMGLYIKSGYRLTKEGHKYLYTAKVTSSRSGNIYIGTSADGETISVSTSPTTIYSIKTATVDGSPSTIRKMPDVEVDDTLLIENFMCFDLTQMGYDSIVDPSEFTSLFSLPYYDYNQGTLIPFSGNGIKTVGKNLFNSVDVIIGRYVNDANGVFGVESNSVSTNYIEIFPNTEYKIISAQTVIPSSGMWGAWYDANKTFISGFSNYATAKTSPSNAKYMAFTISYSGRNPDYANNVMLLFNGGDETFEPYTESTLSLPISTYFPTGMKSAGSVYDELTETKAITRVGSVDLGSLEWTYYPSATRFYATKPSNAIYNNDTNAVPNAKSSKYETVKPTDTFNSSKDKLIALLQDYIFLVDKTYTDGSALKTSLNGVMLYYELATPTETSFTTASLVTGNAEIPLSNEDGVLIGKCTEQLSSDSGFFDAKIKLADEDGECYSNKIQLHVERKP